MKNTITYKGYSFSDVSIKTAYIGEEMSLPITSLGIDTLEAEVVCDDPTIVNFRLNDPVIYYRTDTPTAVYFVQGITRSGVDRYIISAVSSLGRLEKAQHYGGIYNGDRAEDVIKDICGDVPVLVKTSVRDLGLYGYLPIASARDNLAQVLFAIGANLTSDLNGVLRVQNMFDGLASYIDDDREYIGGKVDYSAPVSSVVVVEHSYTVGTEARTLFDGTATAGQRITFGEPVSSLTATGFDITESGANYAIVTGGTGTIEGIPYSHSTLNVVWPIQAHGETVTVDSATLVGARNSAAVALRLGRYYTQNEMIKTDSVILRERPGQVVQIYHPYRREMVSATIAKNGVNASATLKGSVEALVGFLPPQAEDMQYFDTYEILTGSGIWTPPAGVSLVTVVCIAGGAGGGVGQQGEGPTDPSTEGLIAESSEARVIGLAPAAFPPANGGGSGTPGQGGKVSVTPLEVSGPVSYSCGVGGAGAVRGGAAAQEGTASTFGAATSDSGAVYADGYKNPISGTVYADGGVEGYSGGTGGGPMRIDNNWQRVAAPDLTIDGQTWSGGADGDGYAYGSYGRTAGPGFGGGAAYGADGNPGGKGSMGTNRIINVAPGGNGADALVSPLQTTKPTVYGRGGAGGNGGGAAGQWGWNTYEDLGASASDFVFPSVRGGYGSDGGVGADGCIIVFYRQEVTNPSHGYLMERNALFVQDKYTRQITC